MKHAVFVILALLLAACGTNAPTPSVIPPTIDSFTPSPPSITAPGQPVTLNWSISGSYDTLQLTDNVSTNVLNVSGTSFMVSPTATTTYQLTVTNDGGSATSETIVTLTTDAPPTDPTPPETPTKPKITSFTANPSSTAPGQAVTLSWTVTGSPTSLTIDNGVGAVSGSSTTVNPTATTTYTLTATNNSGKDTEITVVTVGSKPEPPTNDVPYYGRWIVTFDSDEAAFVHELDIDMLSISQVYTRAWLQLHACLP